MPDLDFNTPNRRYAGWGKAEPFDMLRHEEADSKLFQLDQCILC
ncbi:hypothetical protein [Singulisphaera sp. GP187]|nr:hypothetical protein [Singulisphaera sp. GP187]